jgi:hypothetical protein
MIRATLLASVLLVSAVPAFAQANRQAPQTAAPQGRGTSDDEKACKNDAIALCPTVIGNDLAVLACFKQNSAKLSPACTGVLKKYGQL